jgi:putative ABC transport system substrate-binding protein
MRRRNFITLLGGAAVASLISAPAARTQPKKLPTIGFLGSSTPTTWKPWVAAFVERLRELGWIDGRTIAIEYRWAEGRSERLAEIAGEFVQLKVDVIVSGGIGVPAAKRATSVIPIVFTLAQDPVGTGLVASLARPGGNVTGVSNQSNDLVGKRLELLREIAPDVRRLAVIGNSENPQTVLEMKEAQEVARKLNLEAVASPIRRAEDIAPTMEELKGRMDALYVTSDTLTNTNRVRLNTLALAARLPTIHGNREYIETGGLFSYAANYPDLFRRIGDYVDRILRGTKPADLPVEQPTKFDLVINLTTARALGLTITEAFLLRADEVIE